MNAKENKELVKKHFFITKLNSIRFSGDRLKELRDIEMSYIKKNNQIITEDDFYKQLLDDDRKLARN